ncbi:hypothetical protein DXG03_008170 [Asterophora parasitica]|uniref:Uncharacterized protein n=1 Tax=Asterophora parasitica TaxID=117018 RepID=A0A9P7K6U2_9AGAR|nr:hypothetical protein DXG03_008170 [Asterophora parasitica]
MSSVPLPGQSAANSPNHQSPPLPPYSLLQSVSDCLCHFYVPTLSPQMTPEPSDQYSQRTPLTFQTASPLPGSMPSQPLTPLCTSYQPLPPTHTAIMATKTMPGCNSHNAPILTGKPYGNLDEKKAYGCCYLNINDHTLWKSIDSYTTNSYDDWKAKIFKLHLGSEENTRIFGLAAWTQIQSRLNIVKPNHAIGTPYTITEILSATTFYFKQASAISTDAIAMTPGLQVKSKEAIISGIQHLEQAINTFTGWIQHLETSTRGGPPNQQLPPGPPLQNYPPPT